MITVMNDGNNVAERYSNLALNSDDTKICKKKIHGTKSYLILGLRLRSTHGRKYLISFCKIVTHSVEERPKR